MISINPYFISVRFTHATPTPQPLNKRRDSNVTAKQGSNRRIFEAIGNKNLDALDESIAADTIDHALPPELPPGLDGQKAFIGMFISAFPDIKMTVEDEIAEGDKVVTRWTATGTHTGELMGIPATGKQVTIKGLDINRFSGGKNVEHWDQLDQMGLMQQLGVIPTPGEE